MKCDAQVLFGTGWTISHHVSTNGYRNHSSLPVGVPFPDLEAAFSQTEDLLVGEP